MAARLLLDRSGRHGREMPLHDDAEPRIRRRASVRVAAVAVLRGIGAAVVAGSLLPSPAGARPPQPSARAYYQFSLAQQERFQRNYLEAVDHLKRAISFDPDSAFLHLELARLYWHLRDTERAVAEGEEAVRLAPDNLEVDRFLANTYTALVNRTGRRGSTLERAITYHERALAVAPEEEREQNLLPLGQLYQYVGRFGDAAGVLEQYLAANRPTANAHFWLSQAYIGAGNETAAAEQLERAVALSPRSPQFALALVDLREQMGDLQGAVRALRMVLSVAPESLPQYARLGRLLRDGGATDQAIAVLERGEIVARENGDADSLLFVAELHLELAETYLGLGRLEEARQRIELGKAEFPTDLRFPLILGRLEYRNGRSEKGLGLLESVLSDDADNPQVQVAVSDLYLQLGAEEEQRGEFDAAVPLLQRSIDVNPDNDRALNYLGYLWADRGVNLDKSIEYIKRALQIGGRNAAYLDSLGWAYYRQERYELAEPELESAASLSEDEPVILEHLGDVYHARGKVEQAVEAWQRALRVSQEDTAALQAKIEAARGGEDLPR